MSNILVTGVAGFIGFHTTQKLLELGYNVVGIDNINDYYDINLKFNRLSELGISKSKSIEFNEIINSNKYSDSFQFIRMNLEDKLNLTKYFEKFNFEIVINLAAQAGVRYSIENPDAYISSNVVGFINILECCRNFDIKHLLYASSSSVYGESKEVPFSTSQNVDNPISIYAATKKSNELMAHTYSHLFNLPTSGLRFFTVYGPWGRPDMAMFLFVDAIKNGKAIKIFNNGNLSRDFTYIDDIVNGIEIILKNPPTRIDDKPAYKVYNIGNGSPEKLMDFVSAIESELNQEAIKEFLPMQAGDVPQTWADTTDLEKMGYKSSVKIIEGVKRFVEWYTKYYNE
tara:strand:- start:16850 stop:17875 length:1026 start_codon:yes stop_codon:yes gene_type:complete